MFRKTLTAVMAAAIALTTFAAAPVQASDKDVAKFIAGAAALAIIGSAIANDNKKDKRSPVYRNDYRHDWRRDDRDRRWHDANDRRWDRHDDRRHDSRRDDRRYDRNDRREANRGVTRCYTQNVGRGDSRTYCTR